MFPGEGFQREKLLIWEGNTEINLRVICKEHKLEKKKIIAPCPHRSDLLNFYLLLLGDAWGWKDRSDKGKWTTFESERQSEAREKSISKPFSAKLTGALRPKMSREYKIKVSQWIIVTDYTQEGIFFLKTKIKLYLGIFTHCKFYSQLCYLLEHFNWSLIHLYTQMLK